MHCRVSPLSYTSNTKLGPCSFTNFFIITKRISNWHHFCKWKFLQSISAGGSFCWNYATDTFYSNYANANVAIMLQLCRLWGSIAIILVVLSARTMLVDTFVAVMQLEVSAALMQVNVSAANIWVTIMHMGVSVAIMKAVFSAEHYAHDYFYCNYAGDCFYCSYVAVLSSNLIFLSLTDTHF